MKKTIRLPAPQLSILKEVTIDLDMTGRHYALLASCEGQTPEDVALSILKDLVEEDATQLTLPEVRYLFMLVKINSLENHYSVNVICNNMVHTKDKDGKEFEKECDCVNHYDVFLSDADLNPTPPNYEVPIVKFNRDGVEKDYKVLPPAIVEESKLYNYFLTERGANQEQIMQNKELLYEFSFLRALLHLVDEEGHRFVKPDDNYNVFIDKSSPKENPNTLYNLNNYQVITKIFDAVMEVNEYGVQPKIYELKCKECGGTVLFQLPLLNGLID